METRTGVAQLQRRPVPTSIIDCDVHVEPTTEALNRYLPERWRSYHKTFARGYGPNIVRQSRHAARADAWPPTGGPPGSDMPFLREQLLDTWNIEYGIINPHYMQFIVTARRPSEYTLALARAINDWVLAEWLEPEPRLRAAIVIPYEDADLAVKEIERLGNHPGFIQVLFMVRTAEPLGRRKYWKIYEAAVRHDLPVAIHVGGSNGHPVTAAGWPSFYLEDHVAFSQAAQAQLVSLVCEGVFEQFPTLKIVLMEGGMAWVAPIMWRLDKAWRLLREETPHLKKLPSEYVRQHFWFTTQPIEEPEKPRHFTVMLKHLAMDDRILFATDYPHWDFDAPDQALPVQLDQNLERKIFAENARSLYKL